MGLFRKKTANPAATPATDAVPSVSSAEPSAPGPDADVNPPPLALDELRAELAALRDRLDESDRAKAELEATVDTLTQRLIVSAPAPPPPPPPAIEPPVAPVDSVSAAHQAETDTAIERLHEHIAKLDERIDLLDSRVTSVSTELANQLTEIGDDIEPMHESAERLAAEQARYQIQFRQDLAELAERIRRPGNA